MARLQRSRGLRVTLATLFVGGFLLTLFLTRLSPWRLPAVAFWSQLIATVSAVIYIVIQACPGRSSRGEFAVTKLNFARSHPETLEARS